MTAVAARPRRDRALLWALALVGLAVATLDGVVLVEVARLLH